MGIWDLLFKQIWFEELIYSYFLLYWMILYFYPSEKIGHWQLQACSHINYHHLE